MRKLAFITTMTVLTMLFIMSGCTDKKENQTLLNFFGKEKYNELSITCTEEDKLLIANELIDMARTVFSDTKKKYTSDEVGALEQYSFYDSTITDSDIKIELLTTSQNGNAGYIWVCYTVMYYRDDNLISGSQNIISRWTIENRNNQWFVTLVEELK